MRISNAIVTGAGIGGLAVAAALARRGVAVTVLEQADRLGEVGAGLQVSPNGMAVLRALGLEPELFPRLNTWHAGVTNFTARMATLFPHLFVNRYLVPLSMN